MITIKIKKFIIFFIIIITLFSNINIAQAKSVTVLDKDMPGSTAPDSSSSSNGSQSTLTDVLVGADDFVASGIQKGNASVDKDKLQEASSSIYNILLICGVITAVLTAAILGIKFMLSSVEEKAEVKAALVPFVIGCIVVFGAFGIWKIVILIANNF